MKNSLKKIHKFIEKFINIFNFIFFLVSTAIWIFFTIKLITIQPFKFSLLWDGFNQMYKDFSFKVSCIFLIIFNGFNEIRSYIFKYYDIKETVSHVNKIRKIAKK